MDLNFPTRPSGSARLVAAAAATGVTVSLGAALLGAFDASSPSRWVQASPEVLADLARCDVRAGRAEHVRCQQEVALQRLEPANASVRVAAEEPSRSGAFPGRP